MNLGGENSKFRRSAGAMERLLCLSGCKGQHHGRACAVAQAAQYTCAALGKTTPTAKRAGRLAEVMTLKLPGALNSASGAVAATQQIHVQPAQSRPGAAPTMAGPASEGSDAGGLAKR